MLNKKLLRRRRLPTATQIGGGSKESELYSSQHLHVVAAFLSWARAEAGGGTYIYSVRPFCKCRRNASPRPFEESKTAVTHLPSTRYKVVTE